MTPEQQLWFILDQQQERELSEQEKNWVLVNYPEHETLLEADE
jgi:hypothetical protein